MIDAATLAQYATAPATRTCDLEKGSHGVDQYTAVIVIDHRYRALTLHLLNIRIETIGSSQNQSFLYLLHGFSVEFAIDLQGF